MIHPTAVIDRFFHEAADEKLAKLKKNNIKNQAQAFLVMRSGIGGQAV